MAAMTVILNVNITNCFHSKHGMESNFGAVSIDYTILFLSAQICRMALTFGNYTVKNYMINKL